MHHSVKSTDRQIAIIGAGPVGLAAAAHALIRGATPIVLEAGSSVGANVLAWEHVRTFSPWSENIDLAALSLLAENGWQPPIADDYPTGRELVDAYLRPLAESTSVAGHVRLNTRVIRVARLGLDAMQAVGRDDAPFTLTVATRTGEAQVLADAVIDASGTVATPNPLGARGEPARGEPEAFARIFYGLPNVLGAARTRYADKRVLVVGSGHSAFNVLADLGELLRVAPRTEISWVVRRPFDAARYDGVSGDALPARAELGARTRALAECGVVSQHVLPIRSVRTTAAGVCVSDDDRELGPFDEVIAVTGFRPDLRPLKDLRLRLDRVLEAAPRLVPLIDPSRHSCNSVPTHGAPELRHPERDFYIAGMKSYGRAPTFLMRTGYAQVRSILDVLVREPVGSHQPL